MSVIELGHVMEAWWRYVAKKTESNSIGIVPKLIRDYDLPREKSSTIKLSVVVAPELGGLGKLANAERPHVYVEGT